jgi:hypothetical protein
MSEATPKKNNTNNMYMKKTFRFALMAAAVCGLSLVATSCKDDDNDSENNGSGEPTAKEIAIDNANTFWGVAANLVSPFA